MDKLAHKSTFILDSPPGNLPCYTAYPVFNVLINSSISRIFCNLPLLKPGHTDFKSFMQVLTYAVFNSDILTWL